MSSVPAPPHRCHPRWWRCGTPAAGPPSTSSSVGCARRPDDYRARTAKQASPLIPGGHHMYGTVTRYHLKPGAEEESVALARELEQNPPPGYVGGYTFRLDSGGSEYITAAVWSD